ncbi:MAG: type II toxin-antitoxin system VapC family toxin [Candidatus Riflebacteria bacterium]|nr:type II toxin-antitoxin system VapC family toxin [Candidatus Riflebacteria bacterium]
MIVVDTSIIAYYFIPGKYTEMVEKVFEKDSDWVTSRLWKFEFRNVLAGYIRKKLITPISAIRIGEEAEMKFHQKEFSVPLIKIIDLVGKSKCTAYDCEFVACAEELGIPLITADKEILKHFPSTGKSIEDFLSS